MVNTIRGIVVITAFVLSAASAAPQSNSTYTPPPAAEPAPAALPGSYTPGLGLPQIMVRNNWGAPLFVSITDANGGTQTFTVESAGVWEIRVAAGTFSYNVTDGAQSVNGTYYVELDNSYDWTFAAQQ